MPRTCIISRPICLRSSRIWIVWIKYRIFNGPIRVNGRSYKPRIVSTNGWRLLEIHQRARTFHRLIKCSSEDVDVQPFSILFIFRDVSAICTVIRKLIDWFLMGLANRVGHTNRINWTFQWKAFPSIAFKPRPSPMSIDTGMTWITIIRWHRIGASITCQTAPTELKIIY